MSFKYLLICADLFSDLGNQFVQLTLFDELVFQRESAMSNLLVMCMVEQGPSIFLSPLAGLCIDRFGGRKLLMFVNLIKYPLVGVLVFTSCRWVIFSAYLWFITCSLFFNIGRLSLTPVLISRHDLIRFNSLNERVCLGARIFGPLLIGWLVLNAGRETALGLAALSFTLSVFALYRLPESCPAAGPSGRSFKTDKSFMLQLFQYKAPFKDNPLLRVYFVVFGALLLGNGVMNFGLPLFFKKTIGMDISDWGMIMSGFQAGSFISTIFLPIFSSMFNHKRIIFLAFLGLGAAMAILAHVTTHILIAVLMILFGCGSTLLHVFLESLIQKNSPTNRLSKTMSFLTLYRGSFYLIAILTSALFLGMSAPQTLLLAGSLAMVAGAFLTDKFVPTYSSA
jgi:Na+/melibiose symporter-like transporter